MRERAVGGWEPDDTEQHELVELWHVSRIAFAGKDAAELIAKHGSVFGARIAWIVDEFLKKHQGEPHVVNKWIYVWAVENLGHFTTPVEVSSKKRSK